MRILTLGWGIKERSDENGVYDEPRPFSPFEEEVKLFY